MMMNGEFLMSESGRIAKNWPATPGKELAPSLKRLYQAVLTRSPTPDEMEWAARFLKDYSAGDTDANMSESWSALCHTLVMSNDFIHVW